MAVCIAQGGMALSYLVGVMPTSQCLPYGCIKTSTRLNTYQYITYCSEFNPREHYLLQVMWPEFHLTAPDTNMQLGDEFHLQAIFMIYGWADLASSPGPTQKSGKGPGVTCKIPVCAGSLRLE